jgi:transcription elongation factor GreA
MKQALALGEAPPRCCVARFGFFLAMVAQVGLKEWVCRATFPQRKEVRSFMAEKEVLLTPDGLAKLEKELEHLKTVRRRQVAARIKQALEFGDISENSEYDDAKNEQAFVEGRVLKLEKWLRNARLIDNDEVTDGAVSLGTRVKLKDLESGEEFDYVLVGSAEADPSAAKISNESPVGKAVMGKSVGSVVEVHAPAGLLRYQVVGIAR